LNLFYVAFYHFSLIFYFKNNSYLLSLLFLVEGEHILLFTFLIFITMQNGDMVKSPGYISPSRLLLFFTECTVGPSFVEITM